MPLEVPTFEEFPKIPRLTRMCTITEKIDGTNASILISDTGEPFLYGSGKEVPFLVGSRTRWIQPENDNYGFARWAYENATELLKLGPGHHFGEWWGGGIQRGYGFKKGEKFFSLFNTGRWKTICSEAPDRTALPGCVGLVPVLFEGIFSEQVVKEVLGLLAERGSQAAPGFMDPEGIVVYHHASRTMFKKTIKGDEMPKGSKEVA